MKKTEIPEFVFKKQYDYYFLLTEYDIVFNENFNENFDHFLNKIFTKKLIIYLNDIPKSINTNGLKDKYFYDLPFPNALKSFHELEINNIPLNNINHFITDNTLKWEIFISIENELSIVALDKSLIDIFNQILKPYEVEPLEVKLRVIGGQFVDDNYRSQFIKQLKNNYNF